MRVIFAIASVLILSTGCSSTLKVAEERNISNTKEIGVEWGMNESFKRIENFEPVFDSLMMAAIDQVNAHNGSVVFRKKEKKDKNYITIDFETGKRVGTGGKIAGYTVTGIGIAALPVTLVLSEFTFFFGFYFWPHHQLQVTTELSGGLADDSRYKRRYGVETSALFASDKKQIPKLYNKYVNYIVEVLTSVETQLAGHEKNS